MDNVRILYYLEATYMAKSTWQLNFKSESVDKQPSDKDGHKIDAFIPEFQNKVRILYYLKAIHG